MVHPAILSTLTQLSVFLHSNRGAAAKILLAKTSVLVSLKGLSLIRQPQPQKSGTAAADGERASPSPAETLVGLAAVQEEADSSLAPGMASTTLPGAAAQLSFYAKLLRQTNTSLMIDTAVGPGHASAAGGSHSSPSCW